MEREVGGGIGMGNRCKPMAVLFQCMTKFTTNKKKKEYMVMYIENCKESLKDLLELGVNLGKSTILVHKN